MKKIFTLMLLAAVAMTASARQIYIFGDDPFGGWQLAAENFHAMTLADDGVTNTIEFTLEKEGWYVFTDGIETAGDWDAWKKSHRFNVNEVGDEVEAGEYNWTLKQVYGDESIHLAPGTYKITIVAEDLDVTEPVTYETKNVYLDDQTTWASAKLYAWGEGAPELFGSWGTTLEFVPETVEQDGVTYKVYPFEANGMTYKEFIFSDNGAEEGRVILADVVADKDYVIQLTDTEALILDITINGVNNVKAATATGNAAIYNLAGQRVDKNYKGIVIQNGKKYVVK